MGRDAALRRTADRRSLQRSSTSCTVQAARRMQRIGAKTAAHAVPLPCTCLGLEVRSDRLVIVHPTHNPLVPGRGGGEGGYRLPGGRRRPAGGGLARSRMAPAWPPQDGPACRRHIRCQGGRPRRRPPQAWCGMPDLFGVAGGTGTLDGCLHRPVKRLAGPDRPRAACARLVVAASGRA